MDFKEFKRRSAKKDKVITVRTTHEDFKWMKKHKIMPSKVFDDFLARARKRK